MQIMSLPAIVGLSLGAAIAMTLSKRNRESSKGRKTWLFVCGFTGTLVALLLLNFGIYYFQVY